ncbi:MAG: class II D-tagatose-bisphosphate aldolase, non-catalytic subunit, partial [Smithella sp.]
QAVPGMVYEAHSTDYQSQENLSRMVEDHFAILKVGPALTFAYREALIGLIHIEELLADAEKIAERSDLLRTIKQVMVENPAEWEKYLPDNEDLELAKIFSYSDRIRYYWGNPRIQAALEKLLNNLRGTTIPIPVIRQYFPLQYEHIREGRINNTPGDIIVDHIREEIIKYSDACNL